MSKNRVKRTYHSRGNVSAYSYLLQRSNMVIVCAFFFLVAGISCGAFMEVLMTAEQKAFFTEYLSSHLTVEGLGSADYQDIFISSLKNNLLLLVIMALPPLFAIGFPLSLAALAYKGMTIGFSSALLIENMSYKGTALTFVSMVPQNLIILPAMLAACIISVNMSFLLLQGGFYNMRKNLSYYAGSYVLLHITIAAALISGALIEAFICPALTDLVL